MAYVSTLNVTSNSITVDISGLSARQNTYGGFRFRINGGSWISVSVDSSYAGYDSPNYTFTGLSPNTSYTIEGAAYTNAWYPADTKYVKTSSSGGGGNPDPTPDPTPSRPSGFSWTWAKNSGGGFYISASEWNSLCAKVNEFRAYKKLSSYSFSYAYSGSNFTATHYNEVRNALNSMTSYIPPWRYMGEVIYASDINQLATALNSIS